jgi:hypothetical protein
MNAAISADVPTAKVISPVRIKLGRLLGGLALVILASDLCFWNRHDVPGLSVGVFFTVLAAGTLLNRTRKDRSSASRVIGRLLAGGILESIVETGCTNTIMLLVLTMAWAGDTYFTEVASLAGRCLSQLVAMVRAPGRVVWLLVTIAERTLSSDLTGVLRFAGMTILLVPSLLLVLGFGSLLASGNAVFGTWAHNGFAWIWEKITFDLDPWRLALWGAIAVAVLPLLRPVQVSAWWWVWTERLPRWPDLIPHRAARLNSVLILTTMNVLFAVANLADVLFLWSGRALPAGVTYSSFVHSGVNSLTATVVLSAIVLTSIFQQTLAVAGRRYLKILAGLWIAQNLFLLLSVGLRLMKYMEAYDMTVERLSVIIFLVLVAVGYGLLAVKIACDKSLSWLAGGGMLVVCAVLYIAQFLNLAGWTADYNVATWERNQTRQLDVGYLHRLGPAAWPALTRAEKLGGTTGWEADQLHEGIDVMADEKTSKLDCTRLDGGRWREFSLRAWWNRSALQAEPK